MITPDFFKNKTFLIAGAAGFVPGHVAEYYLKMGAVVIGLDNFITGTKKNIQYLSEHFKNFEFIECDVSQGVPAFDQRSIDFVLSLASPASPIDFAKIPLEIMQVNSQGTLHLLELARIKKARFLEASTSEVYGDPEVHPQTEDYVGHVNTVGPRSCYDESKRFAEAMVMNYHWHKGVDTRIVRIFNTYGPRMRPNDGRVIPNFINQALMGEDITVYGDGSQTRSFCFVSDLVMAITEVLLCNDPTPFNIGNPDEYTIKETAEMILKLVGGPSKIIYKDLPKDDPKRRRPDITKLKKLGSYRPLISFEQGLNQTIEHFRHLLK